MKPLTYPTMTRRRFDIKTIIIAVMAVIIVVLLLLAFLPKLTTSLRADGFKEGVQLCQTQIITKIVNDLNTQQFTAIQIGGQTVKLGIMDVKEIRPQQSTAAQTETAK